MASTYTPSLGLTLPTTGELVGTWGIVVNSGVTSLVEQAIAGTVGIAMTVDTNYTLSDLDGQSDEARNMFINVGGGPHTITTNVICPSVSKMYFVYNGTTGGQSIEFKTAAGTGVLIPPGRRYGLYCDGTDVYNLSENGGSGGAGTTYNVKDYGATGDGVTNDTTAILAAKAAAVADLPATLYFPKGTYKYSDIGNLAYEGLTVLGDGSAETVLLCTNTTATFPPDPTVFALYFYAYPISGPAGTHVKNANLKRLTVEGNSSIDIIVGAQGIDYSEWEDVNVREASNTGYGFNFVSCAFNTFTSLACNVATMSSIPNTGLKTYTDFSDYGGFNTYVNVAMVSVLVAIPNCINVATPYENFINPFVYADSGYGLSATPDAANLVVSGGYIYSISGTAVYLNTVTSPVVTNTAVNGSTALDAANCDSMQLNNCTVASGDVSLGSSNATLISGGGYSSITSSAGAVNTSIQNAVVATNVTAAGVSSQLLNCKVSGTLTISDSINGLVSGGYYDAITIDSSAKGTVVQNVELSTSSAWTDNGVGTQWSNLYDGSTSAYFYPYKALYKSATGTAVNFTDIPAGTRQITLTFSAVSTNNATNPIIQVGSSAGYITTGYTATGSKVETGSTDVATYTTGFGVNSAAVSSSLYGEITLTNHNAASVGWICTYTLNRGAYVFSGAGFIYTLTAVIDRVRVTTLNGTTAFNNGTIDIRYSP